LYLKQAAIYVSSDKDPEWPLLVQLHATQAKKKKTQQSTYKWNKDPWTLFLCIHSMICEFVQLD
jgi:hypothetical protein